MTEVALEGLRVLEYARFVSGPYCSRLLADLGAEVIKVEEPVTGDEARRRGPFPDDVPHPEKSGLFIYLNMNKLGITLNLKTVRGREIFKDLVREVDILVENNSPSLMKELGLDYDSLKRLNQRLVMTSITPFGQTGPYREYKSYYLNTFHGGGEGYLLPAGLGYVLYPDREPIKAGGFIGEYDIGLAAATATLGAYFQAQITGEGQYVDVSGTEVIAGLMRYEFAPYNDGWIVNRASWALPIGGLVQCKDGFVEIMPLMEHMYEGLLELIDPELAKDERYQYKNIMLSYARPVGGEEDDVRQNLKDIIEAWALKHTKEEIYHRVQANGCAAGIIATPEDVLNSEQLKARHLFVEIDHPEAGVIKCPSSPCIYSQTPWRYRQHVPRLGEHNEEILCSRIGLSSKELRELSQTGVI
ncbi:MAG: CoA transferase [Dehalococcoidia bacterium]|nr:MAG: CoA transferase [Dehalococcoidia bacterium]